MFTYTLNPLIIYPQRERESLGHGVVVERARGWEGGSQQWRGMLVAAEEAGWRGLLVADGCGGGRTQWVGCGKVLLFYNFGIVFH